MNEMFKELVGQCQAGHKENNLIESEIKIDTNNIENSVNSELIKSQKSVNKFQEEKVFRENFWSTFKIELEQLYQKNNDLIKGFDHELNNLDENRSECNLKIDVEDIAKNQKIVIHKAII